MTFFMRDGFHLTEKGAAVLGCEFVRVAERGHRYRKLFKLDTQGELTEKTQRSRCSPVISENELKCVCLNARSIINKKVNYTL